MWIPYGLFEVNETSDGFEVKVGGLTYHLPKEGGPVPVDYSKTINILSLAIGSSRVKGTITLSILQIPRKDCTVSATPVSSKSDWEIHLWPLPPTGTYTSTVKVGKVSSLSTEAKGEVSFPDILITVSNSGTSKHRQWAPRCARCLEIKSSVSGSFNVRINYAVPLALAFAPVGAAAGEGEGALDLGLRLGYAQ